MQDAARIARKLAALEGLGLERVDRSPSTTEATRIDRKTYQVTSSKPAMGTLVSVTAIGRTRDEAEEAIGRGFEEMDRLIPILSRYEASSAVTCLNDSGRLSGAPPEFSRVLSRSLYYHWLSGGTFDISVEPLVNLFRERLDGTTPTEPSRAEVAEALGLVGSQNIVVGSRSAHFARSGMGITLDGIAKGYIVDAIAGELERSGIGSYLINAGGDIRTAGSKPGQKPWTVAVQDPSKRGSFPDTVHLTDGAVATSGSYEIYFDRDRLFHHVVDSKSGRSPDLSQSVSVQAPTAMAADALATGVFVMEPRKGVEFIDSLPGCECLVIDNEGRQLRSRSWKSAAL
jgi:thiamine biosynthesis lipoprotein